MSKFVAIGVAGAAMAGASFAYGVIGACVAVYVLMMLYLVSIALMMTANRFTGRGNLVVNNSIKELGAFTLLMLATLTIVGALFGIPEIAVMPGSFVLIASYSLGCLQVVCKARMERQININIAQAEDADQEPAYDPARHATVLSTSVTALALVAVIGPACWYMISLNFAVGFAAVIAGSLAFALVQIKGIVNF